MKSNTPGIVLLCCLPFAAQANVDIVFDYTYDNGFLSGANAGRRALLDAAAEVYEYRLQDSLTPIVSGGGNSADFAFLNPNTPVDALPEWIYGASIGANEIRIYVSGSHDLNSGIGYIRGDNGSILGTASLGSTFATGTGSYVENALSRGQAGALGPNASQTDWGGWGGSISFDALADWYFDSDPSTPESHAGYDFYSVALHEIGHILGFGKAPSYFNLVSGGTFNGAAVTALTGTPQPVNGADTAHWQNGLLFAGQLNAMNPVIAPGQRLAVTELDFAALDDLGWEVSAVPEASHAAMLLSGLALLGWRLRSQRRT
ncbi:MAG: matrixin family metalloprotease [Thiobacillus sp.]|nr:matrixin family metalloprotease [Thiobacillus sp.]